MTTLKHTPGPWTRLTDDPSDESRFATTSIIGSNDKYVLSQIDTRNSAEGNANLRLIAAAPELLEALKLLLVKQSFIEKNCDPLALKRIGSAMPQIRAAIAKAEGKP